VDIVTAAFFQSVYAWYLHRVLTFKVGFLGVNPCEGFAVRELREDEDEGEVLRLVVDAFVVMRRR